MKQINVPTYNDSADFEDGNNTYPCSTQYMYYNGMEHKYYLTEEAISYHNLDVEGKYLSDSNNKVQDFIKLVTKKVYDYIHYKVGFSNVEMQMYRIATAPKTIWNDQYLFRKEFENALVSEAKWLLDNADSARYAKEIDPKRPEDIFMDDNDIATETKRTLQFLGLTRWVNYHGYLDQNKF